jgi:Spy/CpxP family protein refolding chaperone
MITESKYKILIWLVIILFALILSTWISLFLHTRQNEPGRQAGEMTNQETVARQGARQFRETLGLDAGQLDAFRQINQSYNQETNRITYELERLRVAMVEELGKPDTDEAKIREINREFGDLHEKLKNRTADYYLEMKALCNEEQKQKLFEMFRGMVQKEEPVPAGQGRRRGRGWDNN